VKELFRNRRVGPGVLKSCLSLDLISRVVAMVIPNNGGKIRESDVCAGGRRGQRIGVGQGMKYRTHCLSYVREDVMVRGGSRGGVENRTQGEGCGGNRREGGVSWERGLRVGRAVGWTNEGVSARVVVVCGGSPAWRGVEGCGEGVGAGGGVWMGKDAAGKARSRDDSSFGKVWQNLSQWCAKGVRGYHRARKDGRVGVLQGKCF